MSSQSQERRAYLRALASGLIVPTLLIAAFLTCVVATPKPSARSALAPLPVPALPAQVATTPGPSPTLCLATSGDAYGFSDDGADHVFWALVEGGERRGSQTIGSTDDRARRAIARASRREPGKFLYLRIDSRDYIVRDPKVLMAAREPCRPPSSP